MITRHPQFPESLFAVGGPIVPQPELEQKLYDTFLKMRDLLDEYAPSWYPEALRASAEAIVREIKK